MIDFQRINNRLLEIKLVIGGLILNVVSAYAPHSVLDKEVNMCFWEELDVILGGFF